MGGFTFTRLSDLIPSPSLPSPTLRHTPKPKTFKILHLASRRGSDAGDGQRSTARHRSQWRLDPCVRRSEAASDERERPRLRPQSSFRLHGCQRWSGSWLVVVDWLGHRRRMKQQREKKNRPRQWHPEPETLTRARPEFSPFNPL